jgi:hypothetical protein
MRLYEAIFDSIDAMNDVLDVPIKPNSLLLLHLLAINDIAGRKTW